jgi:hypothetical protein
MHISRAPMFITGGMNVNLTSKIPCSTFTPSLHSDTFMTTDAKNIKSSSPMPSAAQGSHTPGTLGKAVSGPEARWDETRGLLAQALADWENSEQRAIEMLKEAEAERTHLEDLLLKLKAKLQELS